MGSLFAPHGPAYRARMDKVRNKEPAPRGPRRRGLGENLALAALALIGPAVGLWLLVNAPAARHAAQDAAKPQARQVRALTLVASLHGSGLADSETGAFVYPEESLAAELDEGDRRALSDWNDAYDRGIDRDDPRRARFVDDAAKAAFEAQGRALYQRLAAKLGTDRLSFMPDPGPGPLATDLERVAVRTATDTWPLADLDNGGRSLVPALIGVSRRLDEDLAALADFYDKASRAAAQPPAHHAPPLWSPQQAADFEAKSRRLAVRLAREFAATDRGHVRVYVTTLAGAHVEVEAGDEP